MNAGDVAGVLDIPLYAQQIDFVRCAVPFTAFVGGVGSGKSMAGAAKSLAAALGRVGDEMIPVPNTGMITAPTKNVLRDATLPTFRGLADSMIDVKNSAFAPPIRVRLLNGSEILFRSADDPELLRGPNVSWWWGDEAALYGEMVWKIMLGRLRQYGRRGFAWLTTTPKGKNWIWKRFISRNKDNYRLYHVSTQENPFLDVQFIEALEEDYQGDFARQELGGEFIAFEGLIYSDFNRNVHVVSKLPSPDHFVQVIAGQDWGMVNPGVLLVMGITSDGRMYLLHEEYARRRGIDDWAAIALQLRDVYGTGEIFCDPSEPDYIAKYRGKGLKAMPADNTVSTGIQLVTRRLAIRADNKPGLLLYSGAVHTSTEFEQYMWARRGEFALDQPVKANDHCMDALRYAVMGADHRQKQIRAEVRQYA